MIWFSAAIYQNKIYLSIQWSHFHFHRKYLLKRWRNVVIMMKYFHRRCHSFRWCNVLTIKLSIWKFSALYDIYSLSFQLCPKAIDLAYLTQCNVINNEYALYKSMNISDSSWLMVLAGRMQMKHSIRYRNASKGTGRHVGHFMVLITNTRKGPFLHALEVIIEVKCCLESLHLFSDSVSCVLHTLSESLSWTWFHFAHSTHAPFTGFSFSYVISPLLWCTSWDLLPNKLS